MKQFMGEDGREWIATAREEDTPRHHGRWFMVLHPADSAEPELAVPEVRWKNERTARRTLETMGDFELKRRLRIAFRRHETPAMDRTPFGAFKGGGPGAVGGSEAG